MVIRINLTSEMEFIITYFCFKAPDLNNRDWKINVRESICEDFDVTQESHYLIAELFYIIRPITHCLYLFSII